MKYWMLAFGSSLLLCSVSAESSPGLSQMKEVKDQQHKLVADDPQSMADAVFREGVEHCNLASKVSRVDTEEAKAAFSQYLSYRERAVIIDPELFVQNVFAQRESKRCDLVQDNIARVEAMPIVEEGLAMCQQARSELKQSKLEKADTLFQKYTVLREQALEKTPTVLRVGSVAVKVRMCDSLAEKIGLAKVQEADSEQKVEQVLAAYEKSAESCAISNRLMKQPNATAETITNVQALLSRSQTLQQQVDPLAQSVLSSSSLSVTNRDKVMASQKGIQYCGKVVAAKIRTVEERIAKRQATPLPKASVAEVNPVDKVEVSVVSVEPAVAVSTNVSESVFEGREMVQVGGPDL